MTPSSTATSVPLSGKRALVCGGTQGIGRACAEVFAERGASVTVLARDPAKLAQTVARLATPSGATHDLIAVDFAQPDAVREAVRQHLAATGPYHILLNNTGGPPPGPIVEATADAFLAALRAHLLNNHHLAQALLPGMKAATYGRIINITSTSVREPIKGLGVSNTTRAAVAAWAKTLASEVAPFGITVNNILPGYTRTGRLEAIIATRAAKQNLEAAEVERQMLAEVPMARFADPREIALAAAFLASPDASFITGVSLPVDGGRIAAL